MSRPALMTVAAMVLAATAANAAEPGTPPVPAAVRMLEGCWVGKGEVTGKPVIIAIKAAPVALDAMFLVAARSEAEADAEDKYAAHLLFGGAAEGAADPVVGFWADSFGGAYTATGAGRPQAGGFDMSYRYPNAEFVNRWRLTGERLSWTIAARDASGKEQAFAAYTLARAACPSG